MDDKKIARRDAIAMIGAAGAALAFGCGAETTPTGPSTTTTAGATPITGGTNTACAVTPSETVGPFPSVTDLFRSDIREDRPGTPLTLTITVVNTNNSCSPVAGANVEIFADRLNAELAAVSGDPATGLSATFQVGFSA